MRLYFYIIFAVLFAFMQTSLLTSFSLFSLRLPLSALVALCLLKKDKGTIYFAIISGLILDIYSSTFFGMNILIFLAIYFILSLLLESIFTESGTMTTFFLTLLATIIFFILSILFSYLTKILGFSTMTPDLSFSLLFKVLVSGLVNCGFVFILVPFFKFANELFVKKAYRKKISF